jgi:hypothetical protein
VVLLSAGVLVTGRACDLSPSGQVQFAVWRAGGALPLVLAVRPSVTAVLIDCMERGVSWWGRGVGMMMMKRQVACLRAGGQPRSELRPLTSAGDKIGQDGQDSWDY